MGKNIFVTLLIIYSLAITGCADRRSHEAQTIRPMASSLTKLSSEVEALIRYGNPPENATEDALFAIATKNDKGFIDAFGDYKLRLHAQNKHAIILLCTKDGKRGLLEDLGCTGTLDRNLWEEDAEKPCAFSLSIDFGCAGFAAER